MKPVDSLEAVDAGGILPGPSIVASPFDQVLELAPAAEHARVQDPIHVVLLPTIDLNGWRGWYVLARKRVAGGVLQQGYVEHWVDPHGIWQAQVDGVWGAEPVVSDHFEWAEAPVV